MPKTSYLIPLYKADRFVDIISENIAEIQDKDAEIILSDRNGDTRTIDELARRFPNQDKIRYLICDDNGDWVDNINGLIAAATGEYFRILPHDDSIDLRGCKALEAALDADRDAVLAYGRVTAKDLNENSLPGRDHGQWINKPPGPWPIDYWLDMFWNGTFEGAFKGLLRTKSIRQTGLQILKTKHLTHSERAWLFGLCLIGKYTFVDEITLTKRYYAESTSRTWSSEPETWRDAMETMIQYCAKHVHNRQVRAYLSHDLQLNGQRRYRAALSGLSRPDYRPYPDTGIEGVRQRDIRQNA